MGMMPQGLAPRCEIYSRSARLIRCSSLPELESIWRRATAGPVWARRRHKSGAANTTFPLDHDLSRGRFVIVP